MADWEYVARVAETGSQSLTWREVRDERLEWMGTAQDDQIASLGQILTEDEEAAEAEEEGEAVPVLPVIGNGDVFQWKDHYNGIENGHCSTTMLARGALIKPWLPREIKDKKQHDPSAKERFEMLQTFVRYGLEHWGSDSLGISVTRRFLLEWLSFLCRYVPAGLVERGQPQAINQRPPPYRCRDDLETMMSSMRP